MISIVAPTRAPSWLHDSFPVLTGVFLSLAASLFILPSSAIANHATGPEGCSETVTEIQLLGRSPEHHYVVIIPVAPITQPFTASAQLKQLQAIRTIAPRAFLSGHPLGDYIYVGGFDRYHRAKEEAQRVRLYSGNVHIVYFP
jgi:hypothetical protein